jgi:multidrug resistance efflux pump
MPDQTQKPITAPVKQSLFKKPWIRSAAGMVAVVALLAGAIIYKETVSSVYVDLSVISAPVIALGPQSAGILQAVYVRPGDMVTARQNVAEVGTEVLTAKIDGLIVSTQDVPGQVFSPGAAVVSMIDPTASRVVGTIDENKGLSDIKVGDPVSFTVDAFGSKTFTGIVDEISPTANDTSVVFSISDQRPTNRFKVKVRYDVAAHPEFKNDMSAKMWVYPK